MKQFKAIFKKTTWFNGGVHETVITRNIDARTLQAATNKAKKMETFGKTRTWYQLETVEAM